jgi:hypothetical protein
MKKTILGCEFLFPEQTNHQLLNIKHSEVKNGEKLKEEKGC